ncbi:MAG TPA: SpoIIE family protein phosphatase [Candidatus Acidoferrales bacterium]|nr:SpoIIE family protein phosphatase [Candidatus Acidoferrales bacterium]
MGGTTSLTAAGTAVKSEASPGPFLGIHAVNVFVRDYDRSLRFYVDKLGFELAFDGHLSNGERWVAVAPPDGSTVLNLLVAPGERGEKLVGRPTGAVFITEDVLAKYEEWHRRGVEFIFTPRLRRIRYERIQSRRPREGQSPVWGGVYTRFKDIDGNSFALVGFDEVNREIEAQRRRAAERLEMERRAAQELEIAKQVQARLFPQTLPQLASLDYAGVCIQARQIGGDYHDFLDLGRKRFGFVIADIAGKGIAAALLMANLQANLRSQSALALDEPERMLRTVNRLFYENTDDSAYATLFFAEIDDSTRRVRYANCGHLPPLLLRANGDIQRLDATATVLGLFREWDCCIGEAQLAAGDTLVLYTDGVTESFNDAGEDFGVDRLIESVQCRGPVPPKAAIPGIVDEVRRFAPAEQQDDITLILARCR